MHTTYHYFNYIYRLDFISNILHMYCSIKSGFKRLLLATSLCLLSAQSTSVFAQKNSTSGQDVVMVQKNKYDNTVRTLTFSESTQWSPSQYSEIFNKYLNIDGGNSKMVPKNTLTTKLGIKTDKYQQYINNIPVAYAEYAITSKNNKVSLLSGNYYAEKASGLKTTADIAENQALQKALNKLPATVYAWQDPAKEAQLKNKYHKPDTSYYPNGTLVYIADFSKGIADRKLHLAWHFHILSVKPLANNDIYIDATTGDILLINNYIKHALATNKTRYSGIVSFNTAKPGANYVLYDSTRGNGVHTMDVNNGTNLAAFTEFTSATNNWPSATADTIALDAHWAAQKVYDYFFNELGRFSYDNLNSIIEQYVHYDVNFDNAFWDGNEMIYGDGSGSASGGFDPLVTMDIVAHEIGHGVCQHTANLIYEYEAGALNEGFSDCWAATIEHYADPHETDVVGKSYWKIGEEAQAGNPLRSMDFPNNEGNPAAYGGLYWIPTDLASCPTPTDMNDQCGVHTNSGVINHWYYFIVNGGIGTNEFGNAYNVNSIGWTDAQNILYQTELILPSDADYAQCRTTSIAVATTLFGACSPQTQAVTNAWYAVGVGTSFVPCTPQLGFSVTSMNVSEYTTSTTCPASRVVNIGLKPIGPAITGGNPIVTVVAAGGTAISGTDYSLGTTTVTFTAGDTATRYATINVVDNGAVTDGGKTITLAFTLNAMGSTATISPTNDTLAITLTNNDSIPNLTGIEYHTLNMGVAATSNLTSAFPGANRRGHAQYLLTAAELTAAGVRAGAPINQIGFNITTKNSTGPFVNYTIRMGNTLLSNLSAGFTTAPTTVYTGNHTTVAGLDSIDFTTPFTWDGTSNVVVEICYGNNASNFPGNDQMDAIDNTPTVVTARAGSTISGGSGCSLTTATAGTARPVMRFKQNVGATPIATVLGNTRTWNVRSGTQVYFYNPADTHVIAGVISPSADLGCTQAIITQAGTGFTPASFSAINRSVKEISITPTTGSSASYNAVFYMTNTELNSVSPSSLFLLKTTATTDATITAANTTLVTPTLITGTNGVGFRASFTGFGRYFLVDGPLCTPPAITVTASGSTTICAGGSVTLSSSTGTGYTYQWIKDGTNIPGATSSSYAANSTGTYSVFVTQGICNTTSSGTAVTVLTTDAGTISGTTGSVCLNGNGTLLSTATGGSWSSSNTGVITINPTSGLFSAVGVGTSTISYSITSVCGTFTSTAIITVNPLPTVTPITGTSTICEASTTTLSSGPSGGVWSSSELGIATVSTDGVVTGLGEGTVTIFYTVTNAFGCTNSASDVVTVNALPMTGISPSGTIVICPGSTTTLSALTGTGYTYQWNIGSSEIVGATNSTFVANAAGNYNVSVTNSNGCSSTSSDVFVSVSTSAVLVPAVSISAIPATVVCISTPVTYNANPVHGGTSPTYQWYVNGTAVGTGATYNYTPNDADVVKCVLTSSDACAEPDTAAAAVTMLVTGPVHPSVSVTAYPNDTVCAGNLATFTAIPMFGGTTPTYIWNLNGTNVATGPAYNFVPNNGDLLYVVMTSNLPCRTADTGMSPVINIHVDTNVIHTVTVLASHATIAPGMADTFTAFAPHAGSAATYQWYVNGMPIVGATTAIFITSSLSDGDVITCRVVSSEACASPLTAYSSGFTINVSSSVTNAANSFAGLSLVPNPNNGSFVITGTTGQNSNEKLAIRVTNIIGQEVYKAELSSNSGRINEQVNLSENLASGTYLVTVYNTTSNVVFKIIINK